MDQVIAIREDLEFMLINEAQKPKPMLFSLLEDITNGFSEENIIGRGGSAVVYKVHIFTSGTVIVIMIDVGEPGEMLTSHIMTTGIHRESHGRCEEAVHTT